MMRWFRPDRYFSSVYDIDFEAEYGTGFRGLIFDIDNTLVPQNAPIDDRARDFLKDLHRIGFQVTLVSNNGIERVEEFSRGTDALWVHNAAKPSRKAYRRAMSLMHTDTENTLFIGDQVLTDIFGARRAHVPNILVDPLDPETDTKLIRFKRALEKLFHRPPKSGPKKASFRKKA